MLINVCGCDYNELVGLSDNKVPSNVVISYFCASPFRHGSSPISSPVILVPPMLHPRDPHAVPPSTCCSSVFKLQLSAFWSTILVTCFIPFCHKADVKLTSTALLLLSLLSLCNTFPIQMTCKSTQKRSVCPRTFHLYPSSIDQLTQ